MGLPAMTGVSWRALGPGDSEAMSTLQQACFDVDGGYRITPTEMGDEFEVYGEHSAEDSIGGFDRAGNLEAMAWCQVSQSAQTEHRAFVFLFVRPDRRRAAVEDLLLTWIEERAGARLREEADDLPSALYRYEVYDTMTGDIDLLERHGYTRARFFTESARDLADPIPEAGLEPPLMARAWSEGVSEDGRAVHNASFADHWGAQPSTRHAWEAVVNEFSLPEASWVVYDGDLPVAYLRSSKYPHDFEDRGRTESWIEGLGTVASHRGRGIASVLLGMAMRAYRDDGMEFACLGVDSESPTGAHRLYERLGFAPEKHWIAFRKPLLDGEGLAGWTG